MSPACGKPNFPSINKKGDDITEILIPEKLMHEIKEEIFRQVHEQIVNKAKAGEEHYETSIEFSAYVKIDFIFPIIEVKT